MRVNAETDSKPVENSGGTSNYLFTPPMSATEPVGGKNGAPNGN